MDLRFSHVDIMVDDLDQAVRYHEGVLGYKPSKKQVWKRGDFRVEFVVMFHGKERIFFAHPVSGNLKDLLAEKGEGTIYRYCFMTEDLRACYRELVSLGVQPVDENGASHGEDNLENPTGVRALWLPKAFGGLSIEIVERESMERFLDGLRATIS